MLSLYILKELTINNFSMGVIMTIQIVFHENYHNSQYAAEEDMRFLKEVTTTR